MVSISMRQIVKLILVFCVFFTQGVYAGESLSKESTIAKTEALHIAAGLMSWCEVKHGGKIVTTFRNTGYDARMILEITGEWNTEHIRKILLEAQKRSFGNKDCLLALEEAKHIVNTALEDSSLDRKQLKSLYMTFLNKKND